MPKAAFSLLGRNAPVRTRGVMRAGAVCRMSQGTFFYLEWEKRQVASLRGPDVGKRSEMAGDVPSEALGR